MLLLKPSCECCDKDLPPDSTEALICSMECTWCTTCAKIILKGRCANCGGELTKRPSRTGDFLAKYPASTERVYKPEGCNSLNR